MINLEWLPEDDEWRAKLRALPDGDGRWSSLIALARTRMDFVRTTQLDRRLAETPVGDEPRLKIALLGSSTLDQLLPAIRIAGLRRGIRIETYVPDYGQFRQAVLDPASEYHAFAPDVAIFLLDARTLVGETVLEDDEAEGLIDRRVAEIGAWWDAARGNADRLILQQALLPVFRP